MQRGGSTGSSGGVQGARVALQGACPYNTRVLETRTYLSPCVSPAPAQGFLSVSVHDVCGANERRMTPTGSRKYKGKALEHSRRGGKPQPLHFLSLLPGRWIPPFREAPTFLFWHGAQVFCLHRLQLAGKPQCLCGGPGPGWGQVASSDRLGKKEGRKGCSREENAALKGFLLDFLFSRRGDAWGGIRSWMKEYGTNHW